MEFQIPPQASLHGIVKTIAHFAPQMALDLSLHANEESKHRVALGPPNGEMF
jgi:hypothetical protein